MRKVLLFLTPIPVIAAAFAAAFAGAFLFAGGHVTKAAALRTAPVAQVRIVNHQSIPRINGLKESTSSNWSGYATTGTKYTDVKGTWTQPSASCSTGQTAYSSFWVGIDGDTTNTVEQLGADADCSSGTPTYYAWYEMYPKFPTNLSQSTYKVVPGDTLSAEVSTNGSGSFTLSIHSSRGWTFSTKQSSRKAKLGSAEWIAEAPSSSGGVLPLADFGTVNFSSCTADGKAISANPNPDAITMASGGTTKAVPSGLGSGGTSFSVTWKHS